MSIVWGLADANIFDTTVLYSRGLRVYAKQTPHVRTRVPI